MVDGNRKKIITQILFMTKAIHNNQRLISFRYFISTSYEKNRIYIYINANPPSCTQPSSSSNNEKSDHFALVRRLWLNSRFTVNHVQHLLSLLLSFSNGQIVDMSVIGARASCPNWTTVLHAIQAQKPPAIVIKFIFQYQYLIHVLSD